jgi:hypothetical protein
MCSSSYTLSFRPFAWLLNLHENCCEKLLHNNRFIALLFQNIVKLFGIFITSPEKKVAIGFFLVGMSIFCEKWALQIHLDSRSDGGK